MAKQQNLTEALTILGITHSKDAATEGDGRHTWLASDGTVIGRYDAHEGWAKLKELVALVDRQKAAA